MKKSLKPLVAESQSSQLVLIDVQARLVQAMSDRKSLLRHCEILIRAATLMAVPVLLTEQYPKGLGMTEPVLAEQLPDNVIPIAKTCFSCCGSDKFNTALSSGDRNQVILAGIEAHVCVLQTALELSQQGRQVFVVADATDSRARENKNLALERLRQAGVIITTTESVLFEWLKDAKHEQFKNVTALIR